LLSAAAWAVFHYLLKNVCYAQKMAEIITRKVLYDISCDLWRDTAPAGTAAGLLMADRDSDYTCFPDEPIRRSQLEEFVTLRKYPDHMLRGTLGKMADVLLLAAELTTAPRTPRDDLGKLVTYDALQDAIFKVDSEEKGYYHEVNNAIKQLTAFQVSRGRAKFVDDKYSEGEMIFDGIVTFSSPSRNPARFERITTGSLKYLAGAFNRPGEMELYDTLLQLVALPPDDILY
jgi:hypothetical protein